MTMMGNLSHGSHFCGVFAVCVGSQKKNLRLKTCCYWSGLQSVLRLFFKKSGGSSQDLLSTCVGSQICALHVVVFRDAFLGCVR
jgi:hypothetical protein